MDVIDFSVNTKGLPRLTHPHVRNTGVSAGLKSGEN
jgi:hypothetical protein